MLEKKEELYERLADCLEPDTNGLLRVVDHEALIQIMQDAHQKKGE